MSTPDPAAKSEHELLLDDFADLLKALLDWRKVIHLQLNGYTILTYTFDFATLMLPSSTSDITVHDDWGPQPPEPDWRAIGNGQTPTGPLSDVDLQALGLRDLSVTLSQQAGRDVNFMIYGSTEAAIQRAPSIILPNVPR